MGSADICPGPSEWIRLWLSMTLIMLDDDHHRNTGSDGKHRIIMVNGIMATENCIEIGCYGLARNGKLGEL